jgi:beta-N-acetylhexosaminidase
MPGWLLILALGVHVLPKESSAVQISKILANLTVEQKVGQLIMIGFGGKKMKSSISDLLTEYHVGAIALYTRNVESPEQVRRFISDIRAVMKHDIQPFIAIDQEGGNVVRVRSKVVVLPGSMTLGATQDPVLAFLAGQAQAVDLRILGFDMNLAPVLDTNHNPKNPVINVRAFSEHPEQVAQMGMAFVRGQQQGGMITVAKHFPGHGTTLQDSHFSLPRIPLSLEQMMATELLPFQRSIKAGLDAMMTAHIQVPDIDPDGTPASLSYRLITGLLRKRLGFDGLIITDDLEMRAISENRGIGKAAVQAILAGADMVMVIWTPHRKREVYQSLLKAATTGLISTDRLDQSMRRILRLKAKCGTLWAHPAKNQDHAFEYLPNEYHQWVAKTISARGLTLVDNKNSVVPLCQSKGVFLVSPYAEFERYLKKYLPGITSMSIRLVSTLKQRERELSTIISRAAGHHVVVIVAGNAYQAWLIQRLRRKLSIPIVVVSMGSPYLLRYFPKVDAYLCTYSYISTSQQAAAQALAGQLPITGRLPVTISKKFPRGHGISIRSNACSSNGR